MNIVFENPDKVNGLLTLTVEKADYNDAVEKQLKDYRKKANFPGFRPGMVPMGLVKKHMGTQVKLEVINKLLGEELFKYLEENKIKMLGQPMPNENQVPQDLEKGETYTFVYDIAVAPEFDATLSIDDVIDYYNIVIDDQLIDRQVDMLAQRAGHLEKAEVFEGNDRLKGDLRELDGEGNTLEGGLTISDATIMPAYVNDEEQQALFNGSKLGDIITINPRKMYGDAEFAALLNLDKEEAAKHEGNFTYQITEINRYTKAEVNQQLFDAVFGEGSCADEEEFRSKIAEGLKLQLQSDQDFKFLQDVRAYLENRIGTLQYPDAMIKRLMLSSNPGKTAEDIDKIYEEEKAKLNWQLIRDNLAQIYEVKVEEDDVRAAAYDSARVQFAQYGMNNIPQEYLDNYVQHMLQQKEAVEGLVSRAIDVRLTAALKTVVNLNTKNVTLDEFNSLMR